MHVKRRALLRFASLIVRNLSLLGQLIQRLRQCILITNLLQSKLLKPWLRSVKFCKEYMERTGAADHNCSQRVLCAWNLTSHLQFTQQLSLLKWLHNAQGSYIQCLAPQILPKTPLLDGTCRFVLESRVWRCYAKSTVSPGLISCWSDWSLWILSQNLSSLLLPFSIFFMFRINFILVG